MTQRDRFEAFVADAEPRLRRALIGAVGIDRTEDAVAEAFAYAYEHWDEVSAYDNPVGYLYRVAQSRSRERLKPPLIRREPDTIPDVEPELIEALSSLPLSQRTAVWLAHGCGWSHADIASGLDVSASTVATHVSRGLNALRQTLGVPDAQS